MSIKEELLKAVGTALSKPQLPAEKRPLNDDDIESFLFAAESRDHPLWMEIDLFLSEHIALKWPIWSKFLQRDLVWLRHQAYLEGLPWGKEKQSFFRRRRA